MKRRWINIALSLIGIGIALLYSICNESCEYLVGSIFGSNLNYLGIFYMGMLIFSNLLKLDLIFFFLLSSGMGAELYLLGFQVTKSVYCFYCLAFGAVVFLLFFLNFEKSRKIFIALSLVIGFILFLVFFKGSVTPVYAEEILLPSYGKGQVKVRLYTDYFCGPCRALEPKLEPIISRLVKKNVINITFIDTPIHTQTTLYAKYFLYILNKKNQLDYALRARALLFEAAKNNIMEKGKLEEFLRARGIGFRPFNEKPTFAVYMSFLKEDKINMTPSCVFYSGVKKDKFTGASDILKAFENLKK
ncbi:MAG: thioredoxin domain-containing protein [Nitrospirota bacterium]